MQQQQAGQTEQAWQDPSKIKAENINSVYQSYVQYPTGHIPKQQQAVPTNQPKLSNKNPVMHLNELRKGKPLPNTLDNRFSFYLRDIKYQSPDASNFLFCSEIGSFVYRRVNVCKQDCN